MQIYWEHGDKKMFDNICLKMLGSIQHLNCWGEEQVWRSELHRRSMESAASDMMGIIWGRYNLCTECFPPGWMQHAKTFARKVCYVDFLFYVETQLSLVFLWNEEKGWVGVKIIMEELQLHVNCLNNLSKCTTCVMSRFMNSAMYMCESSLWKENIF